MSKSDAAYYQRRASEERQSAQAATDPAVASVHLALAEQYERLLSETSALSTAATPSPPEA